jgi:N-methylhydantoinase A/acetone carboxylase, beta subunit
MEVMDAAEAIIRVANSKKAGAIRLISIEQGHNPQEFAAVSFGGGGSLHVCSLIREVGWSRALVPRYPGVTSALGCVIAEMRHDRVQTLNTMLEQVDLPALIRRMKEFSQEGLDLLEASGVFFKRQEVRFELDMSYLGQNETGEGRNLEKNLQQSKTEKSEIPKETVFKVFEE